MLSDHNRQELLAEVASLYYEAGLGQAAIAERIGVSRSNVSRLLTEARRNGVVEVRIIRPLPTDESLQTRAVKLFGLRDAAILDSKWIPESQMLSRVGTLAARYLESMLSDNDSLAISWGTALREVENALSSRREQNVRVVQMIGGVGTAHPDVDGTELARRFAESLGGRHHYMNAPLLVEDPATRRALIQEPRIRRVLEMAAECSVALVGIGAVEPSVSSLLRAGYVTKETLIELQRVGVVGDVCGWHFDIQGRIVDTYLNRCIISLDPTAIKKIPHVVGVAVGRPKALAILGAIRGGFINVLVTDSAMFEEIQRLDRAYPLDETADRGKEAYDRRG